MSEVYLNFLKAGIAVVFLLIVDFIIEFLLIRKIKNKKKSVKLRVSLRYILFFCLLFFMAKIFVEGFGYLLTVVGVIAAALTITQKEYLMNFVGWLIIMWRDLFVEGDYIEVGKYKGYVAHIRPLYFSLEEASDVAWGDKTGRTVKVPNSMIGTNPIINFTVDKAFVEGRISFVFTFSSSLEKIQSLIPSLEKAIEKSLSAHHVQWSQEDPVEEKLLKKNAMHKPQIILRVCQDNPSGVQLKIRYLSLKQDQKMIEDKVFATVMEAVNKHPQELVLSVAT